MNNLSAIEAVVVNIYFWLILFLIAGVIIGLVLVIRRNGNADQPQTAPSTPKTGTRKRKAPKDAFSEKLGEKVVNYMVEVSRSQDRNLIEDRIKKIRGECERLTRQPLPEESKRIISTVLIWSKRFDVDKHLVEMKLFNHSNQINYDSKRRDFKLRISEE